MSTSRSETSRRLLLILIWYRIQSIFADFDDVDQFSPAAVAKYEEALIKAEKNGTRIRALVLCNPHNPLGRSYPKETIIGLLELSNKYKIHLLSDEIYALSIYDNKASAPNPVPFDSVLSLDVEKYIDPNYLQFIYGLSKDTAASGLRLGVLYSRNAELLQAVNAISGFSWSGSANEPPGSASSKTPNGSMDFSAVVVPAYPRLTHSPPSFLITRESDISKAPMLGFSFGSIWDRIWMVSSRQEQTQRIRQ